jgi:hypothetical protein
MNVSGVHQREIVWSLERCRQECLAMNDSEVPDRAYRQNDEDEERKGFTHENDDNEWDDKDDDDDGRRKEEEAYASLRRQQMMCAVQKSSLFQLREVAQTFFLEHRAARGLWMHVETGALVDTREVEERKS